MSLGGLGCTSACALAIVLALVLVSVLALALAQANREREREREDFATRSEKNRALDEWWREHAHNATYKEYISQFPSSNIVEYTQLSAHRRRDAAK